MNLRSARLHGLAALAALSLAAGCRSDAERRSEAEAARLFHHIDQLRNAPNSAKAALLTALAGVPCQSAPACALKTACVEAYGVHLASLQATERARSLLAAPDGGAQAALAAAQELSRAEHELERARTLTERCTSREGELRRAAAKR